MSQLSLWILFNLFVLGMLILDLGFLQRRSHVVKFREALVWSGCWITLACVFATLVFVYWGRATAVEFLTGYTIELSLSLDNLFIFLLIFRYFRVSSDSQHKVLFWGIVGALAMRAVFIVVGIGMIRRFHWITYIFGTLLIYSGIKLFCQSEAGIEPEKNPVLRLFRRWVRVTPEYEGDKFVVRHTRLVCDSAAGGAGADRNYGYAFRHRLHSRSAGHHAETVYRLHLQRICNSGPAFYVLCAGWNDGCLPLPASWSRFGFDFRWR